MQESTTLHCILGGVCKEYKSPNPLNGTIVEASDRAQRIWGIALLSSLITRMQKSDCGGEK